MADLTENFNFLQASNFKVVIDRKKYGNLEFFAQRVIHPGVTVTAPIVPYKRIQSIAVCSIMRSTFGPFPYFHILIVCFRSCSVSSAE